MVATSKIICGDLIRVMDGTPEGVIGRVVPYFQQLPEGMLGAVLCDATKCKLPQPVYTFRIIEFRRAGERQWNKVYYTRLELEQKKEMSL